MWAVRVGPGRDVRVNVWTFCCGHVVTYIDILLWTYSIVAPAPCQPAMMSAINLASSRVTQCLTRRSVLAWPALSRTAVPSHVFSGRWQSSSPSPHYGFTRLLDPIQRDILNAEKELLVELHSQVSPI